MTVLQWLGSIWGITPIALLVGLFLHSEITARRNARANHPTAYQPPETDTDPHGFTIDYPEMYR